MADIAINPVTRRVQFTGNTGTGPFAFTFNILADADIAVYKNTTLLTLTTHYTVTTNANGTGSITLDAGQALISSDVLTIIGGRDLSRTTDFVTAGDLLASSLNEQLDSLVIMTQQLDEKVGRTIKTNPGDVYTDLELPTKDNRKGTVLGFNATSGDPEVGPTIADVSSLASITADIATLADIEDGTDATDAIQTVAGISSNVSTVAGISSNVTTVAGNTSNINAVAADATDIGTVAGSISNVNTVAGIDSNITTVAGNTTNINTVAGNNSNITTVAGVSANVTTVAGISSDVTTVAGISSDVTTVAADGTDIGTVATNIADVNTVASNIATISAKVSKSGDTMTGDLTIQGNLTVSGTTITVDSATAQTIDLGDGDRMRFGDSNDAYIEWNGTYFDARSTGRFDLLSSGNDLRLSTGTNVGLIVNHTGGTPAVQLYNSGVQRLATTSTGIDVTGTVTADGLTVDGNVAVGSTGASDRQIYMGSVGNLYGALNTDGASGNFNITSGHATTGSTALQFYTATSGTETRRIRIDSAGDISFYEDTGTTPKFFWDASTERLGIGNAAPATTLDITGTVTADGLTVEGSGFVLANFERTAAGGGTAVQITNGDDNAWQIAAGGDETYALRYLASGGSAVKYFQASSGGDISFYEDTGTTAKFFWDASAEVLGIGTATPNVFSNTGLHIHDSTTSRLHMTNGTTGSAYTDGWEMQAFSDDFYILGREAAGDIIMYPANSEAMRITSSGNVGIGTTSPNSYSNLTTLTTNGLNGSVADFEVNGTLTGELFAESNSFKIDAVGASSSLRLLTNSLERMRIDSSGRVGIGTSSPDNYYARNLVVNAPSEGGFTIVGPTNAETYIMFADGTSGDAQYRGYIGYDHSVDHLRFGSTGTERMRIDSSGNLLVGTTTAPNGTSAYGSAFVGETNSRKVLYLATSSTAQLSVARFYNPNGQVGEIKTDGSSTLYVTSSDYRLKEDWQPMTGASDRVLALNPVNFAWKVNGSRVDGFLAHEAQAVVPEAVIGAKDAMRDEEYEVTPAVLDENGSVITEAVMGTRSVPDYQGIDQSKLVPLLTAALQEALNKITDLETRITALEAN